MVEDLGSLCLNFPADLAQNESQEGVDGCARAEQGQPLPPLLPAQVSLPYDELSNRFPTLLCPFLLPVMVSFSFYDFAF